MQSICKQISHDKEAVMSISKTMRESGRSNDCVCPKGLPSPCGIMSPRSTANRTGTLWNRRAIFVGHHHGRTSDLGVVIMLLFLPLFCPSMYVFKGLDLTMMMMLKSNVTPLPRVRFVRNHGIEIPQRRQRVTYVDCRVRCHTHFWWHPWCL